MQEIQRTLKIVCAPIGSLQMLLSQWEKVSHAQAFRVDKSAALTKVISDLVQHLNQQPVSREDLHQLELLHVKLNADSNESWKQYSYSNTVSKSKMGKIGWATKQYYVNATIGRGMTWYRLERKSSGHRNYIAIDITKKLIFLRAGANPNSHETNVDFCQGFSLDCREKVFQAGQNDTNTTFERSMDTGISANFSQLMNFSQTSNNTFSTTLDAEKENKGTSQNTITQSVLSKASSVKISAQLTSHKKSPVVITVKTLDGSTLYPTLCNAYGSANINPDLVKKRLGKRKLPSKAKVTPEVVLKSSELLKIQ